MKEDEREEAFRAQFLPVFLGIALLAGLGVYGLLLLTEGPNLNVLGVGAGGVGVAISASIWARRLIARYPVHVSPVDLRAYGLRGGVQGDEHLLEWSMITCVSRFYLPFSQCLVLRVRQDKRR